MKAYVVFALFSILFIPCLNGCEERKSSPSAVNTINFGCRARQKNWYGGKKGKKGEVYSSYASNKSDAIDEAKANYNSDYPDVGLDNIDVNCWDCSTPNLEPQAQKACEP